MEPTEHTDGEHPNGNGASTEHKDSPENLPSSSSELAALLGSRKKSLLLGQDVVVLYDDIEDDAENEAVNVRFNMRRTAEKPCACCCQLCGVWLFLVILLLILMAAVSPVEFDLGVPFYDRDDLVQSQQDAYLAMQRDADYIATFYQQDGTAQECVHTDPTVLTRNGTLVQGPKPSLSCQASKVEQLRLLYVAKDRTSNMLTTEILEEILKIESRILDTLGLTRYCNLLLSSFSAFETRELSDWASTVFEAQRQVDAGEVPEEDLVQSCQRIFSPLNFFDPLYFNDSTGLGYYMLPNDLVRQEYEDLDNVEAVVDKWNDWAEYTYNISQFGFLVPTIGNTLTVRNLFWGVTSSDFRIGSSTAMGLTSSFPLGAPIHGYSSASLELDEQSDETGQWLWDEFDSFLKGLNHPDFDVYWGDSANGMTAAESGYLVIQSFVLFPFSLLIVLIYLAFMQDSIFIGVAGMGQIMLSFVPTLILYQYIFGQTYVGILNLVSIYITLGIGVDNIFVFCDQYQHQRNEADLSHRFQKTFNVAGKAMFTTSCTTFISFVSNASSAFPAVSTFGLFAALSVVTNYLAVITFFPAVYAVYVTRIEKYWWDHPSRLCCFCCSRFKGSSDDKEIETEENGHGVEEEGADEKDAAADEEEHEEHGLVAFFRDRWAPLVIRFRYFVVAGFAIVFVVAVVFMTKLSPDEEAPSILLDGNNYKEYTSVLLDYFQSAGNPMAIGVRWLSGVDPDDPIDRTGTDLTDSEDYGTTNYADCSTFDMRSPEAQVWNLQTCHDMFFGNVTDYHGDSVDFGVDGEFGPKSRRIVFESAPMDEYSYYSTVICPSQGFRDWLLTDSGCTTLESMGLACFNETNQRDNCIPWDTQGNSCEPYPVPQENFNILFREFILDPTISPDSQESNYDKYYQTLFASDDLDFDADQIVRGDFSCRTHPEEDLIFLAMATEATLDQGFSQSYENGIALYEKWDAWSQQMRAVGPREMASTMQISTLAWAFYFLNETLIGETFRGIALSLGLSFLVLTIIGGNFIMAFLAVFTIALIVVDVFAFTVFMGWSLGVVEAINYVVVIGVSPDCCFVIHFLTFPLRCPLIIVYTCRLPTPKQVPTLVTNVSFSCWKKWVSRFSREPCRLWVPSF